MMTPRLDQCSRDDGKPTAAHRPQHGEAATVERRDPPRLIAIGQADVGPTPCANLLVAVLADNGGCPVEVRRTESCQFPCTACEFPQHLELCIHTDASCD